MLVLRRFACPLCFLAHALIIFRVPGWFVALLLEGWGHSSPSPLPWPDMLLAWAFCFGFAYVLALFQLPDLLATVVHGGWVRPSPSSRLLPGVLLAVAFLLFLLLPALLSGRVLLLSTHWSGLTGSWGLAHASPLPCVLLDLAH